jgi:hypothetical protein
MMVWYAGILAKAVAAFLIWRNGLTSRVPALWALLIALGAQAIALVAFHRDPARYALVYAWSSWIILLLEGFSVVGVFRSVTESYPRFGKPGTVLLSALAIIGACACWMVGFLAPPPGWSKTWEIAVFVQRDVALVMIVMLAGSRLLMPRISGVSIRKSARLASDILTVYVIVAFVGSAFTIDTPGGYPFLQSLIPMLNGLALGVLCAVFLTRDSDVCEDSLAAVWPGGAEARESAMPTLDDLQEIGRILGTRQKREWRQGTPDTEALRPPAAHGQHRLRGA